MRHERVYLIGMPGSGKSALGCALARALGLPFADMDAHVEALAGMPIPRIFAERGEPEFRRIERRALESLAAGPARVIATGGGAVLRADNVSLMRETGVVLWIDRPLERILRDLQQGTRPLLAGDPAERLRALHAEREGLYRAAAHLRLDNSGTHRQALACAKALIQAHSSGKPAKS